MSRVLAGFLPAAAALLLVVPGGIGAAVAAAAVSIAILAVWGAGSVGDRAPGRRGARWERITTAGFALSLAAGAVLAAGVGDGPGFFGLPRSLWGLLLGVWLLPLVVTSVGFAASFRPPAGAALERLRAERRGGA